jgi:EAL domain-containing protein (putative c-di-GMP-specific phosphodiesterase class I)
VVYDPEMHRNLIERLELESDLRRAVREGQLEVHYQPMLAIRSEEVVGFEALLRWPHPERGYVPPPVFIGIAEQTDLIHEIGSFVLRTAAVQLADWQARPGVAPGLTMNVNISGRQLQRDDFPASVAEVIADTGIDAGSLVLEITESVLLEDTEGALDTLQDLKGLGIRLAIDDFGTGYSSLSYLHQFPIDVLKIDKSFIDRLGAADQEEVVGTIIQLGSNLRMTTIAEGIEDHAQALTLRRLGCELAQGFHYARPAPADQIERLLIESMTPEMPAAS